MIIEYMIHGSKELFRGEFNDVWDFLDKHQTESLDWYREKGKPKIFVVLCADCKGYHIDGTHGNCK